MRQMTQLDKTRRRISMTKAYLIGQITVTNPEGYARYKAKVPAIIQQYGGRYVVRGGTATQLEGKSPETRHVVLEFPSRAVAEAWYHSPEYQAILADRTENSTGEITLVDGYEPE
jgi:uncharacterized protein (DUF1330 family)